MYSFKFLIGTSQVEVGLWSPLDAQTLGAGNWSLRSLQTAEDVFKQQELLKALRVALNGKRRAFAPAVDRMSAGIVNSAELKTRIPIGNGTLLFREKNCPSDGVFLSPGETFVVSGAGCPMLIAVADPFFVVAHAARDSLVDRGFVSGTPTRKQLSVVNTVVENFGKRGIPPHKIVMCMQFSIPTLSFLHRFDHYEHGSYNRSLHSLLSKRWPGSVKSNSNGCFIDLDSLFVEQARECGVVHAYAMNSLAQYPDLAHTRDGQDPSRRNLIIITRDSQTQDDVA